MENSPRMKKIYQIAGIFPALTAFFIASAFGETSDGAIAMHGTPRFNKEASCFTQADPAAHKGGTLRLSETGAFDSLNYFITLGTAPFAAREWLYDTLMRRNPEEPFTLYPLIAKAETLSDDRKILILKINPAARFKTGDPITASDVLFTFNLLKEKGRFNYRGYYQQIQKIEKLDRLRVRFTLSGENRELPLIIGLAPVFSEKNTPVENFDKPGLTPPEGAGAYRMKSVDPGRSVTLKKDPNYWAENLFVNCGRFNFKTVKIDMFKNERAAYEAFRAGDIDIFTETDLNRIASGYNQTEDTSNPIVLNKIYSVLPTGMYGFALNTRRAPLNDPVLRKALIEAFDYEGISRRYFYNAHRQIEGAFDYSPLAANPEKRLSAQEIEAGRTESLYDPEVDIADRRAKLRESFERLKAKGYALKKGILFDPKDNPVSFEVLIADSKEERQALAFANDIQDLGVKVTVRLVDSANYEKRKSDFDYDIVTHRWYNSLSPGTEQMNYWGCSGAKTPGSRNYAGVCTPETETAIKTLLNADNYETLTQAARELDEGLKKGYYVVPLGLSPFYTIAARKNMINVREDKTLLFKKPAALKDKVSATR